MRTLAAILVASSIAAGPALADHLATYLSADELVVYVSIPDGQRLKERFGGSAYGKILAHEAFGQLREFLNASLKEPFAKLDTELASAIGMDLDAILEFPFTEISFAIFDIPATGEPGMAFVLGAPAAIRGGVERLLGQRWQEWETSREDGTTLYRRGDAAWAVTSSTEDETLVTNRPDFARRWKAREKKSFFDTSADFTFTLSVAGLCQGLRLRGELDEKAESVLRAIGADRLENIEAEVTFTPEGYEHTASIDFSGEPAGLLGALIGARGPLEGGFGGRAPEGALAVSVGRLDLAAIYASVYSLLKAIDPAVADQFEKTVAVAGIDGETDFFSTFDGPVVVYSAIPELGGLVPDTVYSLTASDPARAVAAIDRFAKESPWFQTMRSGEIRVLRPQGEIPEEAFAVFPILALVGLPMAYAPGEDGELLLASTGHALKRHFLRRERGARFLSESDIRAEFRGADDGGWSMASYVDTSRALGPFYNTVFAIGEGVGSALLANLQNVASRADSAVCVSNLRNLGMAIRSYEDDYGRPPAFSNAGLFEALGGGKRKYIELDGFRCRAAGEDAGPGYQTWDEWKEGTEARFSTPIVWDTKPHRDLTRNVLFLDGHVEPMGADEFDACITEGTPEGAVAPKIDRVPAGAEDKVEIPPFDLSFLPTAEELAGNLHSGFLTVHVEPKRVVIRARNHLGLMSGPGGAGALLGAAFWTLGARSAAEPRSARSPSDMPPDFPRESRSVEPGTEPRMPPRIDPFEPPFVRESGIDDIIMEARRLAFERRFGEAIELLQSAADAASSPGIRERLEEEIRRLEFEAERSPR